MISVDNLSMHYRVAEREGGFAETLKAFFHRKYRMVQAVDGISFKIAPGEIVGFPGPNGAGKTTTLKVLAGLLYQTSGSVSVGGLTPQGRKREFLSLIAMVLGQKQRLIWDLPPKDTFLLNKEIYGVSDAQYAERMNTLDALLQLGDLVKRQTRKLSLGERMKCELAAALIHGPKVLFLDEPTIGLDVNMQQAVRSFIADYNKQTGATILLTSHYMADVAALCKRVIIINAGKLVFDGDLAAIVDKMSLDKSFQLHFSAPVTPKTLARYGEIERAEGLEAELRVSRAKAAAVAQSILAKLPVADISIQDTPIEAIVGQLMTKDRIKP